MTVTPAGYQDPAYPYAQDVMGVQEGRKVTYGSVLSQLDLALDYRIDLHSRCVCYACVYLCIYLGVYVHI